MHRIILLGGLGNQMFQYAFFYSMRHKSCATMLDASLYNVVNMHNGFELPYVFKIADFFESKKWLHLKFLRFLLHFNPKYLIYNERGGYDMTIFSQKALYIKGYFQTSKYFEEYKDELINIFQFRNISKKNEKIAAEMQCVESVSLHIRRGDYIGLDRYSNICTEDYYRKAISFVNRNCSNPHFYIFSNDSIWSENFAKKLGVSYEIVGHNTGKDSYQDMYLMSQCKHNIVANSSFSWWGAYLNRHADSIIIAPQKWDHMDSDEFNDIRVPSNWIRI